MKEADLSSINESKVISMAALDGMNPQMAASVEKMLQKIADAVNGSVHSAWLYGSVVMDDFQLGWSDIDILALTER